MSVEVRETYEAQVLAQVSNLGVANGNPFLLMRGADGKFGLAQKIGDRHEMASPWVDPQAAVDVATRILGGDKRAITHPTALQALAVALVGMIAEGQRVRAEQERKG